MEWEMQNNDDIKNITKYINVESIYNRMAITLNKDIKAVKRLIDEEELKIIIGAILKTNNSTSAEDVNMYINDVWKSFLSPTILTNAQNAADKIYNHIIKKNSITYVYCDYDGDGICAGVLMQKGLTEHSRGKVITKFPNRVDGYGINKAFCETIISKHKGNEENVLVITVDNGITRTEEVDMLLKAGMEIVVTDHHKSSVDSGKPNCIVVDPHNDFEEQDCRTKCYCGTTVAFKVLQLIKEKFNSDNLMEYIPYVAIATVTDVMPLSRENNAFIQFALEMINREDTCPEFFKEFKENADISVFTTEQIAWVLGPVLNACGRLGSTEVAAKALLEPTQDNILSILRINKERKEITDKFKEMVKTLNYDSKVIVHIADSDECPRGTIGILAAKLSERFNRPAIAMLEHDGICHGSVRSVNGINMYKLLEELKAEGLITNLGGHAEACVCEFKIENKDNIIKVFNVTDLMRYTSSVIGDVRNISLDITLSHLSETVYSLVSMLITDKCKPPIFVINDLELKEITCSKKNPSNIKMKISDGKKVRELWAWGMAEKISAIKNNGNIISLIGTIKKNFMGNGYVLDILDAY